MRHEAPRHEPSLDFHNQRIVFSLFAHRADCIQCKWGREAKEYGRLRHSLAGAEPHPAGEIPGPAGTAQTILSVALEEWV